MEPWAIVAALCTAIGSAVGLLWRAFLRGDVVFGTHYRQAVKRAELAEKRADLADKRADKAETQAERNTVLLAQLAASGDRRGGSDG